MALFRSIDTYVSIDTLFCFFTEFYPILTRYTPFYRVLSNFTEFYRVLPSFSTFERITQKKKPVLVEDVLFLSIDTYLVFLPSFTEFYRVLPSFTEFYRVFNAYNSGSTGFLK